MLFPAIPMRVLFDRFPQYERRGTVGNAGLGPLQTIGRPWWVRSVTLGWFCLNTLSPSADVRLLPGAWREIKRQTGAPVAVLSPRQGATALSDTWQRRSLDATGRKACDTRDIEAASRGPSTRVWPSERQQNRASSPEYAAASVYGTLTGLASGYVSPRRARPWTRVLAGLVSQDTHHDKPARTARPRLGQSHKSPPATPSVPAAHATLCRK
ncbi:uncharacterized protein CC84DRAFT_217573 [Paraphaeosphaeria sporulosa]|uniref:Uncharacterized protein n=1 Tax=Paraphaeosphaeria sporulosa TaxID=1460663 RepID=A0A177C4M7_9PLEO|nr:uncharacterized protein CC84DRAFT_217573 [Paraphaeosphaeria sporulosa]OAG01748.1 hypothetical protein CC84DRAFT_217573 [Paraphaeosphaeria sporulosa]